MDSTEGLIHYSYYLPEDYDPTRKYPMMVIMPVYHAAANVVFDDADILNWIVSKHK